MTEKLSKIEYAACSFGNSQLVSVGYKDGALEVVLSSNTTSVMNNFKIIFDWVHSFRLTNESDLLKMQEEQSGQLLAGIYIVDRSGYMKWFAEQSAGIHDTEEITHYLLATSDDVIDILSSVEPLIFND
ncbi:hypothetical protein NNQ28_21925 (plasmid) [Cronobacter dublinensis]|uniref:hypothetical protein n=1 Tax=Cronobacter dublinensis TaxID=413497 RepID=UPI00292D5F3C|nr:hypothetical protein [Cronobacter dublinensis]WNY85078.1 hypothetical protein NNQ28_21925 [Cronobacter dublinensis]